MPEDPTDTHEFPQEATLVAALESARVNTTTDVTVRTRPLGEMNDGQPVLVCQGEFGAVHIELTPGTAAGLASRLTVAAHRANDPHEDAS